MLKSTLLLAAGVLMAGVAMAGDTVVEVQHGDGHVDNDYRQGGGLAAEWAAMHHDKVHYGDGHSIQELDTEFGDIHHDDHATGVHENRFHEEGDGDFGFEHGGHEFGVGHELAEHHGMI